MSRTLRDAIERIHSDDFQTMQETDRKLQQNGRKGFWRRITGYDRLKKTPAARVIKVSLQLTLAVTIALILVGFVYYYNQYSKVFVDLDNANALLDNELQRRANLLPNLILVSAEYSVHEKMLYKYVSEMRTYLGKTNSEVDLDASSPSLDKLVSSLLAISEQYPDLKATQSFEQLMKEWTEAENRIAEARAKYIDATRMLNTLYTTIPSNIYGRIFLVKNRKQWAFDESTPPVMDLEKFYADYLSMRAAAETAKEPPAGARPASAPNKQPHVSPETTSK
ncbi:MAG: LemA family protein [Candidatus Hydrogenedentes bacterium]|nr:LemA family protein [Candidatus Hydrogenedentota bacterium]